MILATFERRFIWSALAMLGAGSLLWLARGGRASAAFALTCLLVGLDFLLLARGVKVLLTPGTGVPKGALRRALGAFGARTLLLLLGLYAILHFLPGEGLAVAAGIAGPLAALTFSGLLGGKV